jgi:hypothetical protein
VSAVTVRLPETLSEYLNARVEQGGETKTQVIISALECLRQREREDLMLQGYREMGEFDRALAEADMGAGSESLPEW